MPAEVDNGIAVEAGTAELGAVLQDYIEATRRLQDTHELLQREVVRLRNELASKDRELEVRRRLAALGELAAGLAHEVRNPLGAIQLYSNLLRKECGTLGPALDLIQKIEVGIRAIDGVVQDTLALAPRHGRRAACALRAVIGSARDNCRQKLEGQRVRLRVRLARPDTQVWAEADSLQRVLVNLLVNAAEASPPGGLIQVTVGTPADGEVEVRVIDEGCGLPDEALDRLFDPFFTTKESGTGLGLTIAHRLVEAYGGRLAARNRATGGAEFSIILPAVHEQDAARETSAA
jgi:signal transduction histidine kinase